jgi:hypothetical protein
VLYGFETWSIALREGHRLRVFENRILRRIFGPQRMRMGTGDGSTMGNFIVCIVHLKSRRFRWAVMLSEWRTVGVLSKCSQVNL